MRFVKTMRFPSPWSRIIVCEGIGNSDHIAVDPILIDRYLRYEMLQHEASLHGDRDKFCGTTLCNQYNGGFCIMFRNKEGVASERVERSGKGLYVVTQNKQKAI